MEYHIDKWIARIAGYVIAISTRIVLWKISFAFLGLIGVLLTGAVYDFTRKRIQVTRLQMQLL